MLARSWESYFCLSVRLSVCLSVCPSVTHVLSDEIKEHTAEIFTPQERVINLVFWCQKKWAMSLSTWNLHLKWSTPFEKSRLWPISAYDVSTVRTSDKCSIIANRKSTRSFQWTIEEVRTLPLTPPKGGSKSEFVVFVDKIQVQSNKVCYKVSLCENFQRRSCIRTIPLSNCV